MVGEVADAGAYAHVSVCIGEEFGKEGNALGSGLFSCGMARSFTRGFKVFDSEQGEGKLEVNGRRGGYFCIATGFETCLVFFFVGSVFPGEDSSYSSTRLEEMGSPTRSKFVNLGSFCMLQVL